MSKWEPLIKEYIKKNNVNSEDSENLIKTSIIAEVIGDKLYQFKLPDFERFCQSQVWNKKYQMYNEETESYYEGYRVSDWLNFLQIPEVKDEIRKQQQIINQINKSAAITEASQSGDLKQLKTVKDIQKGTKNKNQKMFIYMNAESIFAKQKERVLETCPNCNNKFLCSLINFGENEC